VPQFEIRWLHVATATVQRRVVDAPTTELAIQICDIGQGIVLSNKVIDLTNQRSISKASLDVAWWCRELKTLLSAGMTVVEALETLNIQSIDIQRRSIHTSLVNSLREGQPLSVAMTSVDVFPRLLIAGVKAGERTSSLTDALDDYLRYYEMLEKLRKQAISASIYPAAVVALGGIITLFLLLFVIPRFSKMYADLHGDLSWTTTFLIHISHILNAYWIWVTLVLFLLMLILILLWRRGMIIHGANVIIEKLPPLQKRIDEFRFAKLYHSLALMFRGGYTLDNALGQCAALELGDRVTAGIIAAQLSLARGQMVSSAFSHAKLTDSVTQRLLAVGERTGNFDRVLQTIAERHANNFSNFVERVTRIIEPVLLLIVALVVGGIVVMMYMPIFDIASSIH